MESRRTRSSSSQPNRLVRSTRMVKSTKVPSHELAKLKTSKPMLVIPQPVLRIHECLDENVRMAQIESNAYIALGIKEEPIDQEYDEEGRYYEDAEFTTTESYSIDGYLNQDECEDGALEIEGMRTTRASKRRRLAGLADPRNRTNEDDNNNKKKRGKSQISKGKAMVGSTNQDFCPVVLSVESLAPTEGQTATSYADLPNSVPAEGVVQKIVVNEDVSESNNNVEETASTKTIPSPKVSKPQLRVKSQQSMTEKEKDASQIGTVEKRITLNDNGNLSQVDMSAMPEKLTDKPTIRATRTRTSKSGSLKNTEGSSVELEKNVESVVGKVPTSAVEDERKEDCEDDTVVSQELNNDDSSDFPSTPSSSSSDEEFEADVTPKLWALKDEERRDLSCSVCKKKFSRVSILTAHKKKHFDLNTYHCTHCNKTFSSESSYKHHIAYSGLAPFKCDRCHKSYYTEQKAEAHRAQCQGKNTERKYHCEECGRSYVMLCSLRTHIRERHSDFKPVKNLCCELCGKRFRHKKYLELHMYSHSSEKKFECDICQRKYKSSDILRHHVRMVHKNLPRVNCEICQKEVSRVSLKAHLNRHREKQEEEEESARHLLSLSMAADANAPSCKVCTKYFENEKLLEMHPCEGRENGTSYPCQHCSISFPTATELVAHSCEGLDNSKSRNTAKIYKCIFCAREYNCHTPWLYHVRHHTNDKPYPCPDCDKSFRLKQGLKVHMRNHTGEKPFKCDQCPAAFKQKPFLLDHMNTHTGNKPYQCQKCLARFSVRSALSTHKRIHRRELKRNSEAASSS